MKKQNVCVGKDFSLSNSGLLGLGLASSFLQPNLALTQM